MPAFVKSVTPAASRPWTGGLVKRRFAVVLTDETGSDHAHDIGPYKTAPTDPGATQAAALLAALQAGEVSDYKNAVRKGINPFTSASRWNTRAALLHAILSDALTLPASDPLVLNGLPYLANVSDAELIDLFGHDQAWVDSMRAQAASLLSSKTALDAYTPIGT